MVYLRETGNGGWSFCPQRGAGVAVRPGSPQVLSPLSGWAGKSLPEFPEIVQGPRVFTLS